MLLPSSVRIALSPATVSWLLCPHCFTWVRLGGGYCPRCAGRVDPSAEDPTLEELAVRLGRATGCLGEVRVARSGFSQKGLPDRGLWVTTDRGLFFLPHRPEVAIEPSEPPSLSVAAAWWAAGLTVGPLALVVPTARFLGFGAGWGGGDRRIVFEPRPVDAGESAALAEHLMADPGAFFLAREAVRVIRRSGPWPVKGWTIECDGRPPVRFAALSDPAGVQSALRGLGRTDLWHGAIVC
ncbi:hypothetical protein [Alienimonas chondri]|uniref:Uncharacterized protein n=1 Tax=Alienimonas chondri TaxID=2681879 RepID=A0ABX1VAL9_9PLAN|nr:hypothetical protein [Alienimonas chondri]NNJ24813.1 hypothetical protein [Alienimonas chondri]